METGKLGISLVFKPLTAVGINRKTSKQILTFRGASLQLRASETRIGNPQINSQMR